jgi:hypothetical protein
MLTDYIWNIMGMCVLFSAMHVDTECVCLFIHRHLFHKYCFYFLVTKCCLFSMNMEMNMENWINWKLTIGLDSWGACEMCLLIWFKFAWEQTFIFECVAIHKIMDCNKLSIKNDPQVPTQILNHHQWFCHWMSIRSARKVIQSSLQACYTKVTWLRWALKSGSFNLELSLPHFHSERRR